MPLIPERLLDEIQSRADIAEVIGRYVPLKRAGRHFKALCPFHKERTPSFHVNTDKQIFHCFGCGAGGNIFSFLMQQERLSFPEAARQLGEQVGVEIPDQSSSQDAGRLHTVLAILEKAARYYERCLAHPQHGRTARAYLASRGVSAKTIEIFRLGCAPMSGWDKLLQAAKQAKISPELLEDAGLVVRGPRGVIDRFRQRLIFPIHDMRGRLLGFGGRSLTDQEPKYLNSPETAVYRKGSQLFGLFHAKEAIARAGEAVVVEGYFDCMLLWQAGLDQVVSPLGTALTPEQARLLRRYAQRVVLAFDADAAGEQAALRGIDLLVETGLSVCVAQLPPGVDPDEYVGAHGMAAFRQLLEQAADVCEFLLTCATKRAPISSAESKVKAAQFILPTVAKVPNAMLRMEYVRLIAQRLDLDEAAVTEELRKAKPRQPDATPVAVRPAARAPVPGAQELFVALLLEQPARWDLVKDEAFMEQISDPGLRQLLHAVAEWRLLNNDDAPRPAQLISRLADPEAASLVSRLVQLVQTLADQEQAWRTCLQRLRAEARTRYLSHLETQLRSAQQSGREQDVARLLADYQQLVKTG